MKKLLSLKIRISITTLLVWWCLWMLNAGRWVFFCYGLMVIHELAHVFCACLFQCRVQSVTIYPFGLWAEVEDTDCLSFYQRILMYGSGPCVHLLVFLMIYFMYSSGFISLLMKNYLVQINLNYLMFNLLPVYPLDGYQILIGGLYCLFPYRWSFVLSEMISLMSIGWLMINADSIVILMSGIVLFLKLYEELGRHILAVLNDLVEHVG